MARFGATAEKRYPTMKMFDSTFQVHTESGTSAVPTRIMSRLRTQEITAKTIVPNMTRV